MAAIAALSIAAILVIAALFAAVTLFRSKGFVLSDLAIFTAPFVTWFIASLTGMRPKSLSNLAEPIVLVSVVLLAFLVRTYTFPGLSHRARSAAAVAVCCGVAVMLYAFVPLLEE
jgi:peptidoglycan/LPS O-acetylase OafA/YrhL